MSGTDRVGRGTHPSRASAVADMRAAGIFDGVAPTKVEGVYTASEHPLDCKCGPCVNGDPFDGISWASASFLREARARRYEREGV